MAQQSTAQQRPLTVKEMLARMEQSGRERANKICPRGEKAELGLEGLKSDTRAELDLSGLQIGNLFAEKPQEN